MCTSGYVPYGWQFKDEDVYIPSEKAGRLNIFGMITRRNQYKGFMTRESINADKVIDYLDKLSLQVKKKTFVVLDNASVHRNAKMKEIRGVWESRNLFLFFSSKASGTDQWIIPPLILYSILRIGHWRQSVTASL